MTEPAAWGLRGAAASERAVPGGRARWEPWAVGALLTLFVLLGVLRYWNGTGDDLASSYVGCRLLAAHQGAALYDYHPENFAGIGTAPEWDAIAKQAHFAGSLHPYVQTPLWAWGLRPLCVPLSFPAFDRVFLLLTMLTFAAIVLLVAWAWAPRILRPVPMAVALGLLGLSQPFRYAMSLMQTHAFFVLLMVAALLLAERRRPVWAGLLLACASAVKITPGFLVLYWLASRRWKAAGSAAGFGVLLALVTYLATGPVLFRAYLENMHRLSDVLLVSQNNQSIAAWWMSHFYPPDEVYDITIYPLPRLMRLSSTALMVACTVAAGWADWRRRRLSPAEMVPLGGVLSLVALTIFAPIAWTHYFVLLTVPVMVLVQISWSERRWWLAGLIAAVLVLNYPPLATDVLRMDIGDWSIIRGQLLSGVLAMLAVALVLLVLDRGRSSRAADRAAGRARASDETQGARTAWAR